jgi:predicted RND superfamily exporter protein
MKFQILKILFFILTATGLFYYSFDLNQINSEKVFLTENSQKKLSDFQNHFNEQSVVVIKVAKRNKGESITEDDQKVVAESLNQLKDTCINLGLTAGTSCQVLSFEDLKNLSLFKFVGEDFFGSLILFPIGEESEQSKNQKMMRSILALILNHQVLNGPTWKTTLTGTPYTNYLLDDYSRQIKEKLFPLLFMAIFICLIMLTGSFWMGCFLFLPSLFGPFISLSAIKFFHHDSNLIFAIIPLVVFVINFSFILHLYYTALEYKTLDFVLATKEKKVPLFLMILTTFIGFFSLLYSPLKIIQSFGLLTSIMIVISSLVTLLWLKLIDAPKVSAKAKVEKFDLDGLIKKFMYSSLSLKKILVLCLLSLLAGAWAYPRIAVLTDATAYFPSALKIRQQMVEVATQVGGTPILDITVPYQSLDYLQLKKFLDLEEKIMQETGFKVLSSHQLVKEANLQYTGNFDLPEHLISYLTLRSQLPFGLVANYPFGLESETPYRITLLAPPLANHEFSLLLKQIESIFKNENITYEFNGVYYHLMLAQESMIKTLFQSFFLSLLLISFVAFFAFKDPKLFFIFLTVNLLPILLSLGFSYLLQFSFNIATVMTYSISLGLIVDSSFHIIHSLKKGEHLGPRYYRSVVRPVFLGSIILSCCFLAFLANSFLPIRQFGVSLGVVILIGMFFDLKVLPTIYLGKKLTKLDD